MAELDILVARFDQFDKRMDERFQALNTRLDDVNHRLDDFTSRLATVEARMHELASLLKERLARVPGARLMTPTTPELSAGVVVVRMSGADHRRIYERLYSEYGIAGAATGGIRLCPHVYTTLEDVERAAAAVATLTSSTG